MPNNGEIAIRLSLKDADVVRRGLQQLGKDGQVALGRIEKSSAPASKALLAVNAVSGDLRNSVTGVASRMGPLGVGLGALGPAGLVAAAGIGAAVLALGAMLRGAERAATEMDALDDAAAQADFGVERLQELRHAAEQSGVTVQQLEDGLRRMTRRVGLFAQDGGGPAADAFKRLGVDVREANGQVRASEDIFDDVVAGLEKIESQALRSAIASAIFGDDAGPKLTLLLNQGTIGISKLAQEARDLGLVLDENIVKRGADAADQLATMRRVIDTQLNGALVDLAPLLVDIAGVFADLARWIGEVVDGFRDIENMSTRGLESRLEELDKRLEGQRPRGGHARRNWDDAFAEREAIMQQLLDRQTDSRRSNAIGFGDAASGDTKEADKIRSVTDALRFQLEQFERTTFGRRVFTELQRAGIDGNHAEATTIVDLVRAIQLREEAEEGAKEAEKERQRLMQQGVSITQQVMTASEAYRQSLTELRAAKAAGAIDEETYARAVESAERRRLAASTDAADGIKRALLDIRDASADAASQWEQDVLGMRDAARAGFVDILSGARSFSDVLGNIFNNIQNRILGRIFDKTIGLAIDSLLGGIFTFHTGGMVGATGGPTTSVSPLAFVGAPRAHTGAMLGLRNDEVPIVAKRGEGVFTPRQMDNADRLLSAAMAQPPARVSVNVYNNAGRVAEARSEWQTGPDGEAQISVFVDEVENRIGNRIARGEGLSPVLQGTFGLSRVAGTYSR